VGIGTSGSMVLRQPCRCRPPLGGHELLHRSVTVLRLERRYDRSLFRGGLLLLALWRCWVLRQRWRWGWWCWWRTGTASRENGIGCQETARHFLPAVGGCEPTVEATSYL
jgi:hypothetical protein